LATREFERPAPVTGRPSRVTFTVKAISSPAL